LSKCLERGIEVSMSESENRVLINRREALLFSATAGLSMALGQPALAMDNTNRRPPRTWKLFYTPHGSRNHPVQGSRFCARRCVRLQGDSMRPEHWRRESLAAGEASGALDRRVAGSDLRSQLPSEPSRLHGDRAVVSSRLGRRRHERGHAQAERLDAEPDR
jgi:hypothetical protein